MPNQLNQWFPTFHKWADFALNHSLPGRRRGRSYVGDQLIRLHRSRARDWNMQAQWIGIALKHRLPLVPWLEAAAQDAPRRQRRHLRQWGTLISQGESLAAAVDESPGMLTADTILAIQLGLRSDSPERTLSACPDLINVRIAADSSTVRNNVLYAARVLFLFGLVMAFLAIWILPSMKQIAEDFDTVIDWKLPEVTVGIVQNWHLVPLLAVLLWLGARCSSVPSIVRRWNRLRHWLPPIFGTRGAGVLGYLADAIRRGDSVGGVLSALARYHHDSSLRHKLLFVRNEVEQGADVWHAMHQVQLLDNRELTALQAANQMGNLDWVLHQLARGRLRRSWRRWGSMAPVIHLLCAAALGMIVLAIGNYILGWLSDLMQRLA